MNSDCAESDDDPYKALGPIFTLPFSFTYSLCFKLGGTFVDEATPLCSILSSLFPGLSWNTEILKRGFKGVFVAFLLVTLCRVSFGHNNCCTVDLPIYFSYPFDIAVIEPDRHRNSVICYCEIIYNENIILKTQILSLEARKAT